MAEVYGGVAQTSITPPLGVELAGYGAYRERVATGVLDELQATALVLQQDEVRLAIVALDLIGVSDGLTARIRDAVRHRCGIPEGQVLLACSHTHSGPTGRFYRGWGEVSPDYLALLPRHVARAVESAARGPLQPVRLSFGSDRVEGVAVNRADPQGPVHDQVDVLAVEDGSRLLAVVAGFACHAVVNPADETRISRDWVGATADAVAAEHDGAAFLLLQGAAGDINPAQLHSGDLAGAGGLVAAGIERALEARQPLDEPSLAVAPAVAELPLQPLSSAEYEALLAHGRAMVNDPAVPEGERRLARVEAEWAEAELDRLANGSPTALPLELQGLRLSHDLALVACGAEVFTIFGERIRRESPFSHTLFVGFSNDSIGYIPDRAEYERGGYAALRVPQIIDLPRFAPTVGDALCATAGPLLERLHD